jgi:hypothetical protein
LLSFGGEEELNIYGQRNEVKEKLLLGCGMDIGQRRQRERGKIRKFPLPEL